MTIAGPGAGAMSEEFLFDIDVEPRGGEYRELLRVGARACSSFGFVIRPYEALGDSVTALLTALAPSLVSDEMVSEWPGTRLLGEDDRARVVRYDLNDMSFRTLAGAGDRLYAWEHPALPEDVFLERDSGTWLTSISHERAAFLTMTADEAHAVRKGIPSLALTVRL